MTPFKTRLAAFVLAGLAFASVTVMRPPPAPAATGAASRTPRHASSRLLDPVPGSYSWPVHGPVIRPFVPPSDPYGPGHRGIDIGAPFGSDLVAAREGVVAFAGWVGGSLFISIDHDDGVRTTYSWLSEIAVRKGDQVTRGQVIGRTGHGHPDVAEPHLHFGARIGSVYIDPMLLLEPEDVTGLIRLALLEEPPPGPSRRPERPTRWALDRARTGRPP